MDQFEKFLINIGEVLLWFFVVMPSKHSTLWIFIICDPPQSTWMELFDFLRNFPEP